MSLGTFFSNLFGGVEHSAATIAASFAEADNFAGVALGMAGVVAEIADPALAPAVAALVATRVAVELAVNAIGRTVAGAQTVAAQIALLTAQAVHVAVLAAPTLTVTALQRR